MLNNITRRGTAVLACVLGAAALTGCAAFAPATPEQVVQKRAAEYWNARINGKPERAYELSTPSYRKLKTVDQFKAQFGQPVSVISAEVADVACEPQKCTAKMKLLTKPAIVGLNLGTVPMYMDDIWLLEDGQWWHYQDR